MSNLVTEEEFESLAGQLRLVCSINIAALALIYFDYALTFTTEQRVYWRKKGLFSFNTILFFAIRYLTLLGFIPFFWLNLSSPPLSDTVCTPLGTYSEWFITVLQYLVACASNVRVSALYAGTREHRYVVILIWLVSLLAPVVFIAGAVSPSLDTVDIGDPDLEEALSSLGCGLIYYMSSLVGRSYARFWITILVYDAVIFILTVYRSFRLGWSNPRTLWRVLLRDGAMYFSAVFIVNSVNIAVLLNGQEISREAASLLNNILPPLLITRLMMNLRVRHQRNQEGTIGVELNIMGLTQPEASRFGRSAFAVASNDNDVDNDNDNNPNRRKRAAGTGNGRRLVPTNDGGSSSDFPNTSRDDSAGSQSEGGKRASHWDGLEDGGESLTSQKHAPLGDYVDEEGRVLDEIQ